MITIKDDRDEWERTNYRFAVRGTDACLSGWGGASGGRSVAVWACHADDVDRVLNWVRDRGDMKNVRAVKVGCDGRIDQRAAHVHVYVVKPFHPALDGKQSNNDSVNRHYAEKAQP